MVFAGFFIILEGFLNGFASILISKQAALRLPSQERSLGAGGGSAAPGAEPGRGQ